MTDQQFKMQDKRRTVSVIMTVYMEEATIAAVLESLAAQTRPPDEVVIVDGGSRDDTVGVIEEYADRLPLHIIETTGCNISQGRNLAIQAAAGDIIAATDAGVRLPPEWLDNLIAPFEANPQTQVAAGFFHADPHTPFEVAMGATVLPLAEEIDPAAFLPSSRSVAFSKDAWRAVGGYPEWLDFCEDLVFDLNLKTLFPAFAFQPEAVAAFRPRGSLRAFWKQYYQYARGDGKADLWRKRHAIRYLTYFAAAPLVFIMGAAWGPLWWGLYLLGGAVYTWRPYQRLNTVWAYYRGEKPPTWRDKLAALLWIPVIRAAGDFAKMAGYPVGWRWRLRHKPPAWRITPGQPGQAN